MTLPPVRIGVFKCHLGELGISHAAEKLSWAEAESGHFLPEGGIDNSPG
jgi:hypothetical protein